MKSGQYNQQQQKLQVNSAQNPYQNINSQNNQRYGRQDLKHSMNNNGNYYEEPSGISQSKNTKSAMQNLYKLQLDNMLIEKQRKREQQKQKQVNERRQFNERVVQNKEAQKAKQLSYKNYYNMLLNNQQQHQQSYVSPYSKRDVMKNEHINNMIDEQTKRMQTWELEDRRRLSEKKNHYRDQLMNQIEQRRRKQFESKEAQQKRQEQFRKYSKLPDQLSKFERERRMEQMQKYRQDLDKNRVEKQAFLRSSKTEARNIKYPESMHNPLVNPLPYNIQNPYILKQMHAQGSNQHTNAPNFAKLY